MRSARVYMGPEGSYLAVPRARDLARVQDPDYLLHSGGFCQENTNTICCYISCSSGEVLRVLDALDAAKTYIPRQALISSFFIRES